MLVQTTIFETKQKPIEQKQTIIFVLIDSQDIRICQDVLVP
jgi:hypothetical protein